MKPSIKDEVLGYFVKEMRERLGTHLKQIILFGSRARGDETAESDYDCLVVVEEASRDIKDIIDELAGAALYKHGAVFSIFPMPEKKLNLQKYNPFYINVAKEGVAL